MSKKSSVCGLGVLSLSLLIAGPALAEEPAPAGDAPAAAAMTPAAEAPAPAPEKAKKSWTDTISAKGYGVIWGRFHQNHNDADDDAYGAYNLARMRIRWMRLVVSASPHPDVSAKILAAFDSSPVLLDAQLTWKKYPEFNITAGIQKIPTGAEALASASAQTFMDRPMHAASLDKSTYRDLGLKIHSGKKGLMDGMLHYQVGVFNGDGFKAFGKSPTSGKMKDLLFAARLELALEKFFLPKKSKFRVGYSPAYGCNDPTDSNPYLSGEAGYLGKDAAIKDAPNCGMRHTADITFDAHNIYVRSGLTTFSAHDFNAAGENIKSAMGYNVDLGYSLNEELQLVLRYDHLNKNTSPETVAGSGGGDVDNAYYTADDSTTEIDESVDTKTEIVVGANYRPYGKAFLVSLFYTHVLGPQYEDEDGNVFDVPDSRIEMRMQVKF